MVADSVQPTLALACHLFHFPFPISRSASSMAFRPVLAVDLEDTEHSVFLSLYRCHRKVEAFLSQVNKHAQGVLGVILRPTARFSLY